MTATAPAPSGRRPHSRARIQAVAHRTPRMLYGLLGVVVAIAGWYLVAVLDLGGGLTPRPDEVAATWWERMAQHGLLFDIRVSVTRVLLGVSIGCLAALPIGFVLAWYGRLRAMFEPLVNFCRALPPIALIPLVIAYFGIGETARISILVYASFFAAVVVLYEGISSIDPLFVRAARVLGASSWEVFSKAIVPAAVPHLITALRVALGVSWATVVAAELIAADRGLGAVIQDAGAFFNMPVVYVGIVMIGVAALLMDYALKVIQRRTTRWQEKTSR
jgi:NitT/TauT family transport system permease protein